MFSGFLLRGAELGYVLFPDAKFWLEVSCGDNLEGRCDCAIRRYKHYVRTLHFKIDFRPAVAWVVDEFLFCWRSRGP